MKGPRHPLLKDDLNPKKKEYLKFFSGTALLIVLAVIFIFNYNPEHSSAINDESFLEAKVGDASQSDERSCKNIQGKFTDLTHNNLGGKGPDTGGEPTMVFSNFISKKGVDVNLVVSVLDEFNPVQPDRNGVKEEFGKICITAGTSTKIKFSLVNAKSGAAYTAKTMHFTIYDIDLDGRRGQKKAIESVQFCDDAFVYADPKTTLKKTTSKGCIKYEATIAGNGADNPGSISTLTPLQKTRTVTAVYENVNSWVATFAATPGNGHCRNFMFSAAAPICVENRKKCTKNMVGEFIHLTHSNLGNKGPEDGDPTMIFSDFISKNDLHVNLVVSVLDEFDPVIPERNGVKDQFGKICITTGTSTQVKFSLVDAKSGEPYTAETMHFSVYDIDLDGRRGKRQAIESVQFCDNAFVYANPMTTLKKTTTNGCVKYEATVAGTGADNPGSISALTPLQKTRTVTAVYQNVNSWVATFAATPGNGNCRNFMFSAAAPLCVPDVVIKSKSYGPKNMPSIMMNGFLS